VLLVDDLGDLLSSPNTALFKLFYSVNCELKLGLLIVFLLSELFDVVRVAFYFADKLADEPNSDSEPNCCLLVTQKLHSNGPPDLLHDVRS